MKRLSRREAIRTLVVAIPAALLARSVVGPRPAMVASALRSPLRGPETPARPFADLAAGTPVGRCTLVEVGPVVVGGVAVTLRSPTGEPFQVDVLRHDPATPGVARAGSLAVYVKNGGAGSRATDEEHGLGAIALAELLARRERQKGDVPALLALSERAPRLQASGVRG